MAKPVFTVVAILNGFCVPVTAKVDVESRAVPPYVLDPQYWASVPVKWLAENTGLENVTTIVWLLLTSIKAGVMNVTVMDVGLILSLKSFRVTLDARFMSYVEL